MYFFWPVTGSLNPGRSQLYVGLTVLLSASGRKTLSLSLWLFKPKSPHRPDQQRQSSLTSPPERLSTSFMPLAQGLSYFHATHRCIKSVLSSILSFWMFYSFPHKLPNLPTCWKGIFLLLLFRCVSYFGLHFAWLLPYFSSETRGLAFTRHSPQWTTREC